MGSHTATLVTIREKPVLLQDGDLVTYTRRGLLNALLGPHVATVVRCNGALVLVSTDRAPWSSRAECAASGGRITRAPIEALSDRVYTHVAVCRPRVPRTAAQIASLRLEVANLCRRNGTKTTNGDNWPCTHLAVLLMRCRGVAQPPLVGGVDVGTLLCVAGKVDELF